MPLLSTGRMYGATGGGGIDPYYSSVVALLHFDGTNDSQVYIDEKGKTWTSQDLAVQKTANFKYGTASGLFVPQDHITTPSHTDFNFGTGEFTVECWVYVNSLAAAGYQGIVVRDQIGGTRGWLLFLQSASEATNDALNFTAWSGATPYTVADTVAIGTGSWIHVAGVRDKTAGDNIRLYKAGVAVGTPAAVGGASIGAPSEPCVVGALWGVGAVLAGSPYLNAYVDDLRITKGVCRYPGGTTFTPSTTAFPNS